MHLEESSRVWSYFWEWQIPGRAAAPNGKILDLGAIRAIDPLEKVGMVLKWRRLKLTYPKVHNQVIPNPTDM